MGCCHGASARAIESGVSLHTRGHFRLLHFSTASLFPRGVNDVPRADLFEANGIARRRSATAPRVVRRSVDAKPPDSARPPVIRSPADAHEPARSELLAASSIARTCVF